MRKHAVRLLRRHAQDGLPDDLQGKMAKLLRDFDGLLGATYFFQLDTLRAPERAALSPRLKLGSSTANEQAHQALYSAQRNIHDIVQDLHAQRVADQRALFVPQRAFAGDQPSAQDVLRGYELVGA